MFLGPAPIVVCHVPVVAGVVACYAQHSCHGLKAAAAAEESVWFLQFCVCKPLWSAPAFTALPFKVPSFPNQPGVLWRRSAVLQSCTHAGCLATHKQFQLNTCMLVDVRLQCAADGFLLCKCCGRI